MALYKRCAAKALAPPNGARRRRRLHSPSQSHDPEWSGYDSAKKSGAKGHPWVSTNESSSNNQPASLSVLPIVQPTNVPAMSYHPPIGSVCLCAGRVQPRK